MDKGVEMLKSAIEKTRNMSREELAELFDKCQGFSCIYCGHTECDDNRYCMQCGYKYELAPLRPHSLKRMRSLRSYRITCSRRHLRQQKGIGIKWID